MKDTVIGKTFMTVVLVILTICVGIVSYWSFGQTEEFFNLGIGSGGEKTLTPILAIVFAIITQIGPTALWVIKELEEQTGHEETAEIMWIVGWVLTAIDMVTNLVAYWNTQSSPFQSVTIGFFQIIMTIVCVGITQAEEVMVFFFAYALHHYNDARTMQGKKPKPWMDMLSRGAKMAHDIRRPGSGRDEGRPSGLPPPPSPNKGPDNRNVVNPPNCN